MDKSANNPFVGTHARTHRGSKLKRSVAADSRVSLPPLPTVSPLLSSTLLRVVLLSWFSCCCSCCCCCCCSGTNWESVSSEVVVVVVGVAATLVVAGRSPAPTPALPELLPPPP